jgi:hypothetical protein
VRKMVAEEGPTVRARIVVRVEARRGCVCVRVCACVRIPLCSSVSPVVVVGLVVFLSRCCSRPPRVVTPPRTTHRTPVAVEGRGAHDGAAGVEPALPVRVVRPHEEVALRARARGPHPLMAEHHHRHRRRRPRCVRACVRACVCACVLACTCACVRACVRMCMRACLRTFAGLNAPSAVFVCDLLPPPPPPPLRFPRRRAAAVVGRARSFFSWGRACGCYTPSSMQRIHGGELRDGPQQSGNTTPALCANNECQGRLPTTRSTSPRRGSWRRWK